LVSGWLAGSLSIVEVSMRPLAVRTDAPSREQSATLVIIREAPVGLRHASIDRAW
jgi:hypothetical protein